jgi:hypothetical protein
MEVIMPSNENNIRFSRSTYQVFLDGKELNLEESVRIHPQGFEEDEWDDSPSAVPSQTALALLLAAGVGPADAIGLYEEFQHLLQVNLPQGDAEIDFPIARWALKRALEKKSEPQGKRGASMRAENNDLPSHLSLREKNRRERDERGHFLKKGSSIG